MERLIQLLTYMPRLSPLKAISAWLLPPCLPVLLTSHASVRPGSLQRRAEAGDPHKRLLKSLQHGRTIGLRGGCLHDTGRGCTVCWPVQYPGYRSAAEGGSRSEARQALPIQMAAWRHDTCCPPPLPQQNLRCSTPTACLSCSRQQLAAAMAQKRSMASIRHHAPRTFGDETAGYHTTSLEHWRSHATSYAIAQDGKDPNGE